MSRQDLCEQALADAFDEEIRTLADAYPDQRRLTLDWQQLARWEHDALGTDKTYDLEDVHGLASDVIARPEQLRESFAEALNTVVSEQTDRSRPVGQASVAFENLPAGATFTVGSYSPSEWKERLFALEGQITKRTEVKPRVDEAAFECGMCGTLHRLPQPAFGSLREPNECQGCDHPHAFFRLNNEQSEFEDYQKLRLQQPPEDARGDTENIDVHLADDLTGTDRVESGGRVTVIARHRPVYTGKVVFEECAIANEVVPDDPSIEDYREPRHQRAVETIGNAADPVAELCDAFAPNFEAAGDRDQQVIEALVLQLLGGWTRTTDDGAHHRGEPHVFLLGDPGVGKTVLARAAYEVAPRSAFTDGTGSSAAGLTAAIEKDDFSDGQWSISAGTLVRAHEGLAVVDELDKGDNSDLDALHTALESQEVHVDKAGKNATLPAQTALLAAGNPTGGHFDPTEEFAEQVGFQSPLLSRFDLILRMQAREERDLILQVAEQMIDARKAAGKVARGEELTEQERVDVEGSWDSEQLAAYIAHARELQPVWREDAVKREMMEWFADLKTSVPERYQDAMGEGEYDGPPLPVTARKLDAMQRFVEASARARLDEEIRLEDVERVKPLIERTLADIGIAPADSSAFGAVDEDLEEQSIGV
jgi:replicative DNA helicase Mcm